MIAKCECQHCGIYIEFETGEFLSGSSVTCPKCGNDTTLYVSPQAEPEPMASESLEATADLIPPVLHSKRGLFGWIADKIEQRKIRIANAREQRELRIAEAKAHRMAYIASVISDLKNGQIPPLQRPNFVLQHGEKICWIEPSALEEIKVVGRHYEGGSAGVSFRVAKGVRFNVGRQRGHLVSETAAVTTSRGELVITNQRLAFLGDGKSFAIKLEKLLEIEPGTNGLKFSEGGKAGPKMVRYYNMKKSDVVCEVLNYVFDYK